MASQPGQKLSLFALTAMVVGSMVGSGIFSLPRTFGIATGPFGAIFAWCIAGGGMYMLARVFQALAERKPDLDAGVYAYAKAGFGDYPGFLSALFAPIVFRSPSIRYRPCSRGSPRSVQKEKQNPRKSAAEELPTDLSMAYRYLHAQEGVYKLA
jgi:hypothetical protein